MGGLSDVAVVSGRSLAWARGARVRRIRSLLWVYPLGLSLACTASSPAQPTKVVPASSSPPGFDLARTGDVHDFDYFAGGWTVAQRKLLSRGVGSNQWEEFPGVLCMTPYLEGLATVDELSLPTKGSAGLTLRTFDVSSRQWSVHWVYSKTGKMDPVPVVGGFSGDRGEFYAVDTDEGRPIKVRYLWRKVDHDHARWEQAFSYDDRSWETNWSADFTRSNTAATCEGGRPRR
jgi:hypothetical protein